MKHILYILIFSIMTNISHGQDYKSQFDLYYENGDTAKQIEVLMTWEKESPNDSELIISYFNYYVLKSRQEVVSITKTPPTGESLLLKDDEGKTEGYLGSSIIYNHEILQKGLDKIDEGIKIYPNRLDMRFGKIYVLGDIEDWEKFTDEIVSAIKYSKENDNRWTWTYNELKANSKDFFLNSVQGYQMELFETENDELFSNMRTIANEILKIYPDHIPSLSNIGITCFLEGEYAKGIEVLLEAEKIDPKDGIILSNIAHGYKLKGDIDNSIKYYEKMLELEDPREVEFARQQIEQLKK